MENPKDKQGTLLNSIEIILIIAVAISGVIGFAKLNNDIKTFETKSNETKDNISKQLTILEEAVIRLQDENTLLALDLEEQLGESERKLRSISGTVGDLEKLSETDPELLQKYSKVYFLNEHYVPEDLEKIDSEYLYDKNKPQQVLGKVWDHLEDLLDDAKDDNLQLKVISGYRDFGTQAQLKSGYSVTYGAGTANQFSADQGYSEHQLGTTVDFTTPTVGASFTGFENTAEYKWLVKNAHKYGFVLSYPPNNNYYQYEPWHWRYVGESLADDLYDDKEYFYNLSQRDIDSYLIDLF